MFSLLLVGCSSQPAEVATEEVKNVDFATVASEVASCTQVDEYADMSIEEVAALLAIDESLIKDAKYFNEGVKSVLVIESSNVEETQQAVNYYLDTVKSTAEKYSPEDMEELDNAAVVVVKDYVVLVVDGEHVNDVKLALNNLK